MERREMSPGESVVRIQAYASPAGSVARIQAYTSPAGSVVRIQAFARANSGGGEEGTPIITEKARLTSLDNE